MLPDRWEWPLRKYWLDIAWVAFSCVNLGAMLVFSEWETVPFHFIWVSLTLLYGFRVWRVKPTMWTLAAVMIGTGGFILIDVARGAAPLEEITEVPLMSAMFLAMVWHARRRLSATEEIKRVSEENLRLLERQRQFTQDASHELRTPITVALGHAELIARTTDGTLMAEDAQVVADELQRLRRLADRLLLLASADSPDFLVTTRVDVENLVTEAVHRWAATARRWRLGDLLEAVVDADEDRLAVALDALLENAVKHTGPEDSIELSVRREGDSAVISVVDSGSGIAEEDLDRIFDRFARADHGRSRTEGGMGLGLAIVKTIVGAHGGEVRVRSTPGKGSVFEIRLPLLPRDGQSGAVDRRATGRAHALDEVR